MGVMLNTQKDVSDLLRQLANHLERDEAEQVLFALTVVKHKSGDYTVRCSEGVSKSNRFSYSRTTKEEAESAARAFRELTPRVWAWFDNHWKRKP